ncbi:MAG: hypothetical protein IID32_05195 [Planctomycetes bacterium]|nr:hypothetical protein [Planctomycetota bacterium]
MMMNRKNIRSTRGASSVLAVFFVTLFAVLAISFTGMTNVNMHMSKNHKDLSEAQAVAESGLQFASLLFYDFSLGNTESFCGDLTDDKAVKTFENFGVYLIEALDDSAAIDYGQILPISYFSEDGLTGSQLSIPPAKLDSQENANFSVIFRQYDNDPTNLEIVSLGQLGKITRTIRFDYDIEKIPVIIFDFALFSRGNIILKENGVVDITNVDPSDTRPLQIGTNSTDMGAINLGNSATINGDILVGPGGDPDLVIDYGSSSTITGDVYAMSKAWEPPPIVVPQNLLDAPSKGIIDKNTTITTSGKYDSINFTKNGFIKINGDVSLFIVGTFIATERFELQLDPEASLTLYLGGDFIADSNCNLNNTTQDPLKLQIYALPTCKNITLASSGDIYATIYAPDTDVNFLNQVDLYGALITNNSYFNSRINIYYDARLRTFETENVKQCSQLDFVRDADSYLEL